MTPQDWTELIKYFGIPVTVLLIVVWQFSTHKWHSDGEFHDAIEWRDKRIEEQDERIERLLRVQEEATPAIKQVAVVAGESNKNLEEMAGLVDAARRVGLLPRGK